MRRSRWQEQTAAKQSQKRSDKSKAVEAAPKFVIESPEKPEFSIEHSDDDEDNIDVSEKLTQGVSDFEPTTTSKMMGEVMGSSSSEEDEEEWQPDEEEKRSGDKYDSIEEDNYNKGGIGQGQSPETSSDDDIDYYEEE